MAQFYTSFSMRDTKRPGYKEYAAKYAYHYEDPKIIHMTKLSTIVFFLNQQAYARENVQNMKTPFVMINGAMDTVVLNSASEAILKKVGNP